MCANFTEELLPKMQYTYKSARHKVPGGWYLRIILRNNNSSPGNGECALFIPDAGYSWQLDDLKWEKIKKDPNGGIYRLEVPSGWVLLSTAQGIAETNDGTKYKPRMGALTFIPDPEHQWECDDIVETVYVM